MPFGFVIDPAPAEVITHSQHHPIVRIPLTARALAPNGASVYGMRPGLRTNQEIGAG